MNRWIDHHCHLDPEAASEMIRAASEVGVQRLVTVGTDLATSRAAVVLARSHEAVWATAGVHPHEARGGLEGIEELLADPEVVAVGECGLDYHYDHSPREIQREVFAEQIALARASGLPLVVHSREAWADTFAILEGEGAPDVVVLHCFTGGVAEAERALDLGCLLSFSGVVTFPSAGEVREAAKFCPMQMLLLETDSPYLAPVPHRGERNQPARLPVIGEAIAAIKGVEVAVLAEAAWATTATAYRLG